MAEQRLIDANYIVEVAERAWDAWNLAMATQDTNRGVNKVLKRQELCKCVKAVAEKAPTIDPQTLPIVQELKEQLAQALAERDKLLREQDGIAESLSLLNERFAEALKELDMEGCKENAE